jgi:hypothetical protein
MTKSNFKESAVPPMRPDGQKPEDDPAKRWKPDPTNKVPDMSVPGPPDKTGLTPSFQDTMPFPPPPPPARKPFRVK